MTSVINLIVFILLFQGITTEDCPDKSEETTENLTTNLYKEDENRIFSQIKEAESKYVPCKSKNCSCFEHVIDDDLQHFRSGITKAMIDETRERGVKYQLINHKLYRDRECMFPSRCQGIEYFINRLRDELNDFEIIINTRDWPQFSKYHATKPLPILSFSKTADYFDIMYPAWSFWDGGPAIKLYPRGLGRWDQHRKSLSTEAGFWPWEKKLKKAFFRGSRTSDERDPLVLLSRKNSKLVDAAYTKNQAWKSNKDTLGMPPAEEESLERHCHYRYLFNFRGVAASFRFRHLFLCQSLVIHVGDEWLEFFYSDLKPWIHYVPMEKNASKEDYMFILKFLKEHDTIAKKIAANGYDFVWNHLKLDDVFCYWKRLLQKYTRLLKFKPKLDRNLIEIPLS